MPRFYFKLWWFCTKNKTISNQMRKKLVGYLIHDCTCWYGYWWYVQYISSISLKLWNVNVLVCRRFGLSTFWLIMLKVMQFIDILRSVELLINYQIYPQPPGMPKHIKCQFDNDTIATFYVNQSWKTWVNRLHKYATDSWYKHNKTNETVYIFLGIY